MKMECPHCGVKGAVDDSLVGKKVKCPKCVNTFVVRAEGSAPIEVSAEDLEMVEGEDVLSKMDMDSVEVDDFFSNLPQDEEGEAEGLPEPPDEKEMSDNSEEFDVAGLLGGDEDDDEFISEKCAGCGQEVHPALLMEVDSKGYCASCVPEELLVDAEGEEETGGIDSPSTHSLVAQNLGKQKKKAGPGNLLKLVLLFVVVTAVCAAVIFYLDIKLF